MNHATGSLASGEIGPYDHRTSGALRPNASPMNAPVSRPWRLTVIPMWARFDFTICAMSVSIPEPASYTRVTVAPLGCDEDAIRRFAAAMSVAKYGLLGGAEWATLGAMMPVGGLPYPDMAPLAIAL